MALSPDVFGGESLLLKQASIETLIKTQESRYGVLSLADTATTSSPALKWNLFNLAALEPEVVSEGSDKPLKKPSVTQVEASVAKLALTVGLTEEQVKDAIENPERFINSGVLAGFAKKMSKLTVGLEDSTFERALGQVVTQDVDLGTTADALRVAISNAMETVEGNGFTPNAVVLSTSQAATVRNGRRAVESADLLYGSLADVTYGLRAAFDANLGNGQTPGDTIAYVGDFSQLAVRIYDQLNTRPSAGAVDSEGRAMFAGQSNQTFTVFEMRAAAAVIDPAAFCAIKIDSNS